jgi:hypothetical protein
MRRLLLVALLLVVPLVASSVATAQRKPPPKLEPLPEAPPPPPLPTLEEPVVRIPVQKEDRVEEVREGGRVVALKVTPPNGPTYYLIDSSGNGTWMRRESLDDGVRVPMWPIYTWD